jgi:TIR domain-containing protein
MAYLSGFKHDIFISYAHLDQGADEWVSRFHSRMEAELKRLTGRDLNIWRDLQLERNQLFDQTIKAAVEGAGLLLALNSYAHKDSDYCQQEVQWFYDRAQKDGWGLSIGDRKRIFNALLNNLTPGEWHPAFGGASGYPFYEHIPGDDIALPCDPDSAEFKAFIRVLARDLFRTLRSFRNEILNKTPSGPAEPDKSKPGGNGGGLPSSSVLLDTHMKDDGHAIEVHNALRSLNVKAIFNQSEDDPGESIKILEARLKQLRRMIIVFGDVQESWVFNRLSMASEIANREKAALKLGIYYAPHRQKGNGGQFRIGSLIVYELDQSDMRNPQALQPLLGES